MSAAPPNPHNLFRAAPAPVVFLQRVFRVYPHEAKLLLWVTAIQLVMRSSSILINNLAQTAFLKRYGVEHLPAVFLIEAALTFVFTSGLGVLMEGRKTVRVFSWLFVFFAGSIGLIRALLPLGSDLVYPVLYILKSQAVEILPILYWDILTDLFTTQQAKRLYTLITAGGILGTTLGSLMTGTVARWVGVDNVLLVFVGGMLLAACLNELTEKVAGAPIGTRTGGSRAVASGTFKDNLRAFVAFSRRSTLLKYMILLTAIPNILLPIMTYQFNVVVDQYFASEQDTLRFFGVFRGISNLVIFLLLLFSGRLVASWGVATSLLFHPINYLVAFAALYFRFDLFSGVYARFTTETIKTALNNPARAILYNFFPSKMRGFVRVFLRGNVVRASDFAGSGFLMIVTGLIDPRLLSVVAAPLALTWILASIMIKRRYASMLMETLREEQIDWERLGEVDFRAWTQDKRAVDSLISGLRDVDPRKAVACGEILSRAAPPGWARAVVDAAAGRPAESQKALLDLLQPKDAGEAVKGLIALAEEAPPETLAICLAVLGRLAPSAGLATATKALNLSHKGALTEGLALLYESGDPQARIVFRRRMETLVREGGAGLLIAAEVAARTGDGSFSDFFFQCVNSGDPDLKAWGLLGLGTLKREEAYKTALASVNEKSSLQLRRSVARVLRAFGEMTPMETFVQILGDEDGEVRAEASRAIRERGSGAIQPLLPALASPSRVRREEILSILEALGISSLNLNRFIVGELAKAYRNLSLVEVLRRRKGKRAAFLLAEHLLERNEETVETALRVLAVTEFKDRMKVILRALHSGNRRDMDNAVEALESALHPSVRKPLAALLEDRPLEEKLAVGRRRFKIAPSPATERGTFPFELLEMQDSVAQALALYALDEEDADLASKAASLKERFIEAPILREAVQWALGVGKGDALSPLERALAIRSIPLFSGLRVREIMAMAGIALSKTCAKNEIVVQEGVPGDALYLILKGELAVIQTEKLKLDTVRQSEFFGEMSLIDREPRSATIKAESDSLLLQIRGEDFVALLEGYPAIPLHLCRVFCGRIRALQALLKKTGLEAVRPV